MMKYATWKVMCLVGVGLALCLMMAGRVTGAGAVTVDTVPIAQMDATVQALVGAGVEIIAIVPAKSKQPNQYFCDAVSQPCYLVSSVVEVKIVSRY